MKVFLGLDDVLHFYDKGFPNFMQVPILRIFICCN